jgi:hypothetical protein
LDDLTQQISRDLFGHDPPGSASRRVARLRYGFEPKIPIWVNFGGPWNGKYWYILWPFGIFLPFGNLGVCNLVHFTPVLVYCITKNLATLAYRTNFLAPIRLNPPPADFRTGGSVIREKKALPTVRLCSTTWSNKSSRTCQPQFFKFNLSFLGGLG